ncbi:MAG: 6-phosphogluconolactonase [Hyphomonadaceae bacterium]|nr:6-phosphogluconolactonase [Hyphomonadaceae bacterium]
MSPLETFETAKAWEQAITDRIYTELKSRLDVADIVSFLVSGGSSPLPIYKHLSKTDLDWGRIKVALVDERWVEPDHDASNERRIRQTLLQNKAAPAQFIGMKTEDETPHESLAEREAAYANLPQPFDVILLGMGGDGHTASLFPEAYGLDIAFESDRNLAAIKATRSDVTGEHILRMTVGLRAIGNARTNILAISGQSKRRIWELAQGETVDRETMPVKAVLELDNITTYWWGPS